MKRSLILLCFCTFVGLSAFTGRSAFGESARTTINFNDDWTFQAVKADGIRQAPVNSKKIGDSLDSEKLGPKQSVRLPHDWAISGPFDEKSKNGGQGKLPWRGVGIYSKTFTLPKSDAEKTIVFDFDGCMAFPEVYINGQYAGGWDYGYLGFQINATPFLRFGAKNTIQVRCDTRKHVSRWYPGAGIYRNVLMSKSNGKDLLPVGSVFVSTKEIKKEFALLKIEVTPERNTNLPLKFHIAVKRKNQTIDLSAPITGKAGSFEMKIPNPVLWSVDRPELYSVTATLLTNEKASDTITFPFGIRSMKYTADDGFYLNGKRLQIYGVDLHHDQGILGAASHPAAIERQLRIMKDMGVNAIRTSHNPNSSAFMDACDRLGFVVWNELFDKWNGTADLLDQSKFDEFTERQVRQFVFRDRNRPSVSLWSIGNEIFDIENNKIGDSNPFNDAARRVKHVGDCYRKYDSTRQVGLGCCVSGTCANGVRDSMDLTGWNYNAQYQKARVVYPKMPLVYSESASAVSTRGYYEIPHPTGKAIFNKKTLQVDGYDFSSVPWGDIPDPEFDRMEKDRYCAGEFVWTGFDYLGEPSPFNEEARSSYFGIVDLCGMPKDRFFLYRSYWNPKETTVHILPHWNWENTGIDRVPVFVYTNGDSAELFLNGKSLGKQTKLKEILAPKNIADSPQTNVTASSEERKDLSGMYNKAANVLLPEIDKRWCAADPKPEQWIKIDLGAQKTVYSWKTVFERPCQNYQYILSVSNDGKNWKEIFAQKKFEGADSQKTLVFKDAPVSARYFKIEFKALTPGSWASIRSVILSDKIDSQNELPEYYKVIDKYRLRWENVQYEPGILEAVASKNGKEIGRQTIKTADKPVAVRLTPEKTAFESSDDLVYILAETVDKTGTPCPLDMRRISVDVQGPAVLAGIGNGNPIGYDILTDAQHPLFYGKAIIVLRSTKEKGTVTLTAKAKDLKSDSVKLDKK